jgi:hypothetical protein
MFVSSEQNGQIHLLKQAALETVIVGQAKMQRFLKTDVPHDTVASPPRFLARQGTKGWMVYDRQLRGPALVTTKEAVNLTKA